MIGLRLLLAVVLATPEQPAVPIELQVELLDRVLAYERGFVAHASPQAVALVTCLDEPGSLAVARQVVRALEARGTLGGQALKVELVRFVGPEALAQAAKDKGADVVIFAPGLGAQAGAVAAAFDDVATLTVATTSDGVREGFVLGFDLLAGKPRMHLNLTRARRQHADFRASVLQLMTVYP
ncbi:MAG: YfiR/HmsC family protein [Myxococcota bacterium]